MIDIGALQDWQIIQLINLRWADSESVWDKVNKTYERNLAIYQNEPDWLKTIPLKKEKVRNNRIFRDMESVIASQLSNLPKPNVTSGQDVPGAKELSQTVVKILQDRYDKDHTRASLRRGLRNLYLGRLFCIKPFWDTEVDDFSVITVDPRKVRISPKANKETEAEIIIEEIEANVTTLLARFPDAREQVLRSTGYAVSEEGEAWAFIQNKKITYQECWIGDWLICRYNWYIYAKTKNPYWDWEGILVSPDEIQKLSAVSGSARADLLHTIRQDQGNRQPTIQPSTQSQANLNYPNENPQTVNEVPPDPTVPLRGQGTTAPTEPQAENVAATTARSTQPATTYKTYYFNHFDKPRKPYIFGTLFAVENSPIGATDLISQAAPLQESIDKRKRDIGENAEVVNGMTLIDSDVMTQDEAQSLRYKPKTIIWGKGATTGVKREFGNPLPSFVYQDLQDSRSEIDNIMGASATFRGQQEGTQETKAGRMLLNEQSYLQSNELVQLINESCHDLFNWWFQLMKTRYTEYHYTKALGKDGEQKTLKLMRDELDDGMQIEIIPGKAIPQDSQFVFERAQNDMKEGLLSPVDYFEMAGYDDPKDLAKNALLFKANPATAVGLDPSELPPQTDDKVAQSISFKDLPPDGQVQLAKKAGIELTPMGPVGGAAPAAGNENGQYPHQATIDKIKATVSSPEFQALPPDKKKAFFDSVKKNLAL